MSDTKKSREIPDNTINYIIFGKDKELNINVVAKNKQEENLKNIPGIPMEIKVEGFEIIKDEKTGKILRIKDNRTINEVIDDKHRRLIEDALRKKEQEEKEQDIR